MDLIFRLETTRDRRGAYTASGVMSACPGSYYGDDHPGPYGDNLREFNRDHIFGFANHPTAKRWWYHVEDLREWTGRGLRLVIWPRSAAPEVHEGRHQCVFSRPETAPLSLPCEALHEIPLPIIERMARDHFNINEE